MLKVRFPDPVVKAQWDQLGKDLPSLQAAIETAVNAGKTGGPTAVLGTGLGQQYLQTASSYPDLAKWLNGTLLPPTNLSGRINPPGKVISDEDRMGWRPRPRRTAVRGVGPSLGGVSARLVGSQPIPPVLEAFAVFALGDHLVVTYRYGSSVPITAVELRGPITVTLAPPTPNAKGVEVVPLLWAATGITHPVSFNLTLRNSAVWISRPAELDAPGTTLDRILGAYDEFVVQFGREYPRLETGLQGFLRLLWGSHLFHNSLETLHGAKLIDDYLELLPWSPSPNRDTINRILETVLEFRPNPASPSRGGAMDDDTPPFAGRPRLFLYYLLAEAKLFHMASPCAPFKEVTPDPTAKFKRMNPVLDKGVQGAVCYANGLLAAGVKGPMGGGAGGASKGGMPSGMSGTCSSTFGIDGTSGPSAADLQAQKNLRFECSFLNLLGGQHPDKALEACMRTNLLATPDDSMLLAIGQILDDLTSALHEALNKVIDDKLGYALEGRTSTAAWNNMQTKVTQTGGVHYIGDPDKFVAACGTEAGPACYHGSDGSIWVFTGSRSMSDIEKDVEHEYGEGYVQEALTAVANDTIKYDPQGTIKGYPDWVKTKAAEILATPGTKKDPNDRPTHRMAQEAVDKLNQEGKFKKKPGTQDCVTDACKAACMERAQLPALMACAAAGMFPSAADKLMFGPGCNGNRCVTDPPSEENSFFPLQTGPAPGKQYCEAAMPTGPDAGGGCGASMSCIGGVPLNKAIWWTDPSPMAHQVLDRVVTFKSPALAPAKTSGKAPDGTTVP